MDKEADGTFLYVIFVIVFKHAYITDFTCILIFFALIESII